MGGRRAVELLSKIVELLKYFHSIRSLALLVLWCFIGRWVATLSECW